MGWLLAKAGLGDYTLTMQHDFSNPAYCKALKNLFKPGSGVRPPSIAGRAAEQALFGSYLGIPHDIVLYGPRGNGNLEKL